MQVVYHPMQKCPAEFVEVFQEVLQVAKWDVQRNVFICERIEHDVFVGGLALRQSVVEWIDEAIEGQETFNRWLGKKNGVRDEHLIYTNKCRKAWLEWLVSPEGHYTPNQRLSFS